MSYKQKILFISVIGIILIGIFGFLIFNNTSVPSEEDKNNISIIENSSKPIIYETTTYKFEPTSKPNFNVGETYHYRITTYSHGTPQEGITKVTLLPIDIFIHVEKMERINKTNCYVLKRDKANCTTEIYRDNKITGKKDKTFFVEIYTDAREWINAENGSVVKFELPNFNGSEAEMTYSQVITLPFVPYFKFFDEQMLCLKENTKWTYEAKVKDPEVGDIEGKSEMRVTGIEKVNGRKCFIYEDIGYTKPTSATNTNVLTLNTKNIYWIDVEKRIMVKQKVIENGLTVFEAELVEITK